MQINRKDNLVTKDTPMNKFRKQALLCGTSQDHRSSNAKVKRLLSSLSLLLKDLPDEQQKEINHTINDLQDGYIFDWVGHVSTYRSLVKP